MGRAWQVQLWQPIRVATVSHGMTSYRWQVAEPWTNRTNVREERGQRTWTWADYKETPAHSKKVGATMHSVAALLTLHPDDIPRPARDVERMEGRQRSHRWQSEGHEDVHAGSVGVAGFCTPM